MSNSNEESVSLFPIVSSTMKWKSPVIEQSWLQNTSFIKEEESSKRKYEEDSHSSEDEKRKKKSRKSKKEKKKKSEKEKMIELDQKNITDDTRKPMNIWMSENKDKLYFFDLIGDPNNLIFAGLYRLDIPNYKRRPLGIGLLQRERLKIKKNGYSLEKISDNKSSKKKRYCSPAQMLKEKDSEAKRLFFLSRQDKDQKMLENYIPLQSEEIQATNDEKREESYEEYLLRKNKEFNEQTQEEPYNIDLWIDFIFFQDEYLTIGKKQTKLGIIEKKISIYEKALSLNPNSERLLLGLLSEAQQIWDSEKVANKWEKTIKEHSQNPKMWKEYILYLQTTFSSFSVSSMRSTYARAIQTLQQVVVNSIGRDGQDVYDLELSLLDIFVISCTFEKQAGFMEKAIALFQALIEFNFFCDPKIVEFRSQLQKFEEFWDSETPRIGDEGALGWCNWTKDPSSSSLKTSKQFLHQIKSNEPVYNVPRPQSITNPIQEEDKKIILKWVGEEENLEKEQWLPCRPVAGFGIKEGEEIDDPERVILFEDIRDYLFRFTCSELKFELLYRFLEFLGLYLPNRFSSNDPYLRQKAQDIDEISAIFDVLITKKQAWENERPIDDSTIAAFTRNVLALAHKAEPKETKLGLAYLSFERLYDLNNARSIAKNILSINKNDLRLWNGYAQMEKKALKLDKARQVYITALSLLQTLPSDSQMDANLLFRSFAELELEQNNQQQAIHILASSVEKAIFKPLPQGNTVPPTRIAKARKSFEQNFDSLRPTLRNTHFVVCYALFEYLTIGFDEARSIFEKGLKKYYEGELPHEELSTAYVKFVLSHTLKYPTPPKILRNTLLVVMEIYPTNTFFLSTFIEGEVRSQISGRIRAYFDEALQKTSSPVLWLFAIHTETARLGSSYRIQSLFDKALVDPKGKHCIGLWKYFMRYELSRGSKEGAKGIFYRAIQQIPWSKTLWMESLRCLSEIISITEFHDILKLMSEKELRIRKLPE